jgi:hypothetical protein
MERKPTYEDLIEILEIWNKTSNRLNSILIVFGITTIVTSVLVSVYTGTKMLDENTIKILAFASTASLTLLTAFNVVKKSNNARKAWRILNAAVYKFEQGIYTMRDLINAYEIGEEIVGDVDFSFGLSSEKVSRSEIEEELKNLRQALAEEIKKNSNPNEEVNSDKIEGNIKKDQE